MPGDEISRLGEARRNALVLSAAFAIMGAASPVAISLGGLAGHYLLGADKSLATAPVTGFSIGLALGALPASLVMREIGRRAGFMTGAMSTALGGTVACAALFISHFWLFAVGLGLIGVGASFVQQYRFAAADASPESFRARAISWVMLGGIFAAVIGPQTVIFTRNLFEPVAFAGAFAALVPLAAVGICVLAFLRMPSESGSAAQDDVTAALPARPLAEIMMQPRFVTALVCGVSSFALMTFMMTGAPLAMVECGFSTDLATLGIQWHVLAMFGPSFITGRLIGRFGVDSVVAAGLLLLMACAVIAYLGIDLWNFWLSLVLLGVGWNFGFIGATAMLTSTYRASEKNKVQGTHDAILFAGVAIASFASGYVHNHYGWDAISAIIWPVALVSMALLVLQAWREKRQLRLVSS